MSQIHKIKMYTLSEKLTNNKNKDKRNLLFLEPCKEARKQGSKEARMQGGKRARTLGDYEARRVTKMCSCEP